MYICIFASIFLMSYVMYVTM